MKKKVCNWLDSNIWGGIHIINNQVQACPLRGVILLENISLSEISVSDIQKKRKELFDDINCGNKKICEGCNLLVEKEEEDINIGPVQSVVLHPYTTCNLNCLYCTLSKESKTKKLSDEERLIAPIIKKFNENGLLKENFSIALGGGEPSLINDMKEIAEYMNSQKGNTNLTIITNSSISDRINYMIDSLSTSDKVTKIHNTSLDSGTAETYKKLKCHDLFAETCNNIREYAKSGIFNTMILKYVMMNDNSNISKKDLKGFVDFVKEISRISNSKILVIIDADMRIQKKFAKDYYEETDEFKYFPISNKQVKAAAYIYHYLKNSAEIKFIGGRINPERSDIGANDVKRILEYEKKYSKNIERLQQIFSVKNEDNHKVVRILGIKIKIRRKNAV